MRRLTIITLISAATAWLLHVYSGKTWTVPAGDGLVVNKAWLYEKQNSGIPVAERRPPDQTFLTYPEWFLVHSPAEQGAYFKDHTATSFPYMAHVSQLWKSYRIVHEQIKEEYKFNFGYHVMIWVIGVSTTVEYTVKNWYEAVIGRMTDTRSGRMTAEDAFTYRYTQDYVDFIRERPWYEYDFINQLSVLWRDVPFTGEHIVRKWERRYFLTSELVAKAAYGWLIGLGTQAAYETALPTTTVLLNKVPPQPSDSMRRLPDGSVMESLPRYAAFKDAAVKLAQADVVFKEIAGNDAAILLTVLHDKNVPLKALNSFQPLFYQTLPSQPNMERVALVTTVPELSETLRYLTESKIAIEHVYDY